MTWLKSLRQEKENNSKIVSKPWGHEEIWAHTDSYVGKLLFISSGNKLSLQYHEEKEETIRVLFGEIVLWVGFSEDSIEKEVLSPGDIFHIRPGVIHRFEAVDKDAVLLEVSTAQINDVVRILDDYDRK